MEGRLTEVLDFEGGNELTSWGVDLPAPASLGWSLKKQEEAGHQ